MKVESPRKGASETVAATRSRTEATSTVELALARAGALAIITSATAAGIFEPTQSMLDSTSALASSLHWDLWVAVESA